MTAQEIADALGKALELGAISGLNEATKSAVGDAYKRLKSAIHNRCGVGSDPAEALQGLEAKPKSDARRQVVLEELIDAKVDVDKQIDSATRDLLTLLESVSPSTQMTQVALGVGIAQAVNGSAANVWVHPSPQPSKDE